MALPDDQRTAARKALLQRFFAAPNLYERTDSPVQPSALALPEKLCEGLNYYLRGNLERPLLLPFRAQGQSQATWYACAHDEISLRALRAELDAFIGPSFADFDDSGAAYWETHDAALDALVRNGLHIVRFRASRPNFDDRIPARWGAYWSVLDRQPPRPAIELRTFAQLRAAFDSALVARNEPQALVTVAALREHHGLTAENRAFLEIRLAAAFGRWDQILAHPRLPELLQLRLPPETYGDIWEAFYEGHLRVLETSAPAEQLVKTFASEVQPLTGPLLKGRGRSRRPAALKALLLDALSQPQPQAKLCKELLEAVGPEAFGPTTSGIQTMVEALLAPPHSDFNDALGEMDLERYEQAWVLLWPLPDEAHVLSALMRCAKEIADPDRASQIVMRLSTAAPDVAAAVREMRGRLLRDVEQLASEIPPKNLQTQVEATSDKQAADIVAYWREIAGSGTSAILDTQPGLADELVAAMETHALEESPVLDSLYPVWFDWLVGKCAPETRLIDVYQAFIETLFVRDRFGETEFELIRLAALHLISASPTAAQYRRLLERLIDVASAARSPMAVRWALDLTDGLMGLPCRDEEAIARWRSIVFASATALQSRLTSASRALLELLAREAEYQLPVVHTDAEPATTGVQPVPQLAKRVLLYSLDGRATERAATVLRLMYPEARFEINNDDVCTAQLKTHSRHAEWIVFVAGCASHQAFFCIKAAMRDEAKLLQVQGTGTTRMIEIVVDQSREALRNL